MAEEATRQKRHRDVEEAIGPCAEPRKAPKAEHSATSEGAF